MEKRGTNNNRCIIIIRMRNGQRFKAINQLKFIRTNDVSFTTGQLQCNFCLPHSFSAGMLRTDNSKYKVPKKLARYLFRYQISNVTKLKSVTLQVTTFSVAHSRARPSIYRMTATLKGPNSSYNLYCRWGSMWQSSAMFARAFNWYGVRRLKPQQFRVLEWQSCGRWQKAYYSSQHLNW